MMTEKRYEIICEDYSLVDVPVYVISSGDKLKFDIYGSKKDAERLCTLLNENELLKKEIEKLEVIIKTGNCSLLQKENEQLKKENKQLKCTIESNSQDDYIDYLEKQNERLKERIEELVSIDKIVFMNG